MAAWSDIAASGARPVAAFAAITLPPDDWKHPDYSDALMMGLRSATETLGARLAGGDTTSGSERLVVTVTVVGEAVRPLGRHGGRPGQRLLISGPTGWSALAVSRWQAGAEAPRRAAEAYRRPRARTDLREALAMATASIDISDGLLADARHLAARSGLALVLDRGTLVDVDLQRAAGQEATALALAGGDDYEVLALADTPLPGFREVGRATAGDGLWFDDGSRADEGQLGWVHGAAW